MIRVAYMPHTNAYCLLNGKDPNSVDTRMLLVGGRSTFDSKKALKAAIKPFGLKIIGDRVVKAQKIVF